ncbi:CAMK/CAMKL/BRSK protein kinase, variant [Fonticula alba]|uniref:non-specific serine/threonine protein kinase n=1 Tax=Fonticula alba TaxID=691883 RepID=A0A058Z1P5_FONAL|nr:CAMK/CAMKL/BRSK protein kinase, variant [Fonticula alba]KCV67853.1 CAMK/CAMKL/BRSK protein kinase, variant [Fonticula alba]|eukprot:XP_009497673.1 CAMK/CAMKL/BRSK protein kinase, variant [Fonticula alba]
MASRVGPYVLGRTLGIGSTGRVRLGTHMETRQTVAAKIVSKEWLSSKASLSKKIEREITLMKLIRHPNVLSLIDVYESSSDLYLMLEHVEGGELFEYLVKRGRLPEHEALIFFQQIICGLDYCHRHLVCHRDLKPENLLLDANMNIKIADFGMAALQPEGKCLETSCGSPHYASPEIIRGEKYDGPAADIWSCGVILYALLTGNLPFDDDNIRRLLSKVKAGVYFMPPSLSEGARDLIKRMLEVDPERRITMQELIQHPWFNMNGPTSHYRQNSIIQIRALDSEDEIDYEVLENLMSLGYDSEEEIMSLLYSENYTIEQVFYHFLLERKKDQLDNEEQDSPDLDPNIPRRRSSSFNAASMARFEQERRLRASSLSSSMLLRVQNPAAEASEAAEESANSSSSSSSTSPSSQQQQQPTRQSSLGRKPGPPPVAIPTANSNGHHHPHHHHHHHHHAGGSGFGGPASPVGSPSVLGGSQGSLLSPNQPGGSAESPGSRLGTPRYNRRVSATSAEQQEPTDVANSPKRSWFASLFNFKGERSKLH